MTQTMYGYGTSPQDQHRTWDNSNNGNMNLNMDMNNNYNGNVNISNNNNNSSYCQMPSIWNTNTAHSVNCNWFTPASTPANANSQPASEAFRLIPPTYQPKESYDAVVTEALNQLSLRERNQAYETIHGVAEDVKETEEFMAQKLQQLEHCLNNIANKPAYDLAVHQNRAYVYDRTFRIKFLRSDEYRAADAAKRMVRYFTTKLDV